MDTTRELIRNFIAKELNRRQRKAEVVLQDDDSLFSSKRTDSLFFVDLIVFLENSFALKIKTSEISRDDLDSIDKMVALVEAQQ